MAVLLNEADVNSIYDSSSKMFNPQNSVTPKIIAARKDPRICKSHIINPSNFDAIYATSDIHADIRNFLSYLNKLKIIKLPDGLDLYTSDIYNPKFITETDWIMNKSMFVIIGDLVDGRRSSGTSIQDDIGSFEYLLHMLIYNLRIKAWSKESDIIFTIGNHDILNAVKTSFVDPNISLRTPFGFLGSQITKEASNFFTDIQNPINSLLFRKEALGIFYLLSPYLFIQIKNKKTNILMIHSQIMNARNYDQLEIDKLRKVQNEIDTNIIDKSELFINSTDILDIIYVLQDRKIELDPDLCNNYKTNQHLIPNIIIVGHCPTIYSIGDSSKVVKMNAAHIKSIITGKIDKGEEYESCNDDRNYGCVIPRCYDNEQDVRIIMVDTGMSSCFREKEASQSDSDKTEMERNRFSEILKIVHDNNMNKEYKIFNKLYRLRTDNREILIKPTNNTDKRSWQRQHIPVTLSSHKVTFPYPLTMEFIKKLITEDYPKMPKEKYDLLISEFEKMNFSELKPEEFPYPNLPADFWRDSDSFKQKYEKYKLKYLKLKNKIIKN